MFIGWENSAALAEETGHPRRNVPRAVFASIAIMAVSYLLLAYATVIGFGDNVTKLGQSAIPFITVATPPSVPSPSLRTWQASPPPSARSSRA